MRVIYKSQLQLEYQRYFNIRTNISFKQQPLFGIIIFRKEWIGLGFRDSYGIRSITTIIENQINYGLNTIYIHSYIRNYKSPRLHFSQAVLTPTMNNTMINCNCRN